MALCKNSKYQGKEVVVEVAIGCGDEQPSPSQYQRLGAARTKSLSLEWETADGTTDDSVGSLRENIATFLGLTFSADGVLKRPGVNAAGSIVSELNRHVANPEATGGQPTAWVRLTFPDLTFTFLALITTFGREAPYDDVATWSLEGSATASDFGLIVEDTPDPDAVAPASVQAVPDVLAMVVGQTYNADAVVLPSGAAQAVQWSSSAEAIATVNIATGVVTAVAQGTATITAASKVDPTKVDTIAVTVTPQVASIDVTPSIVEVQVAGTQQLTADVLPAGADQSITYVSANPAVATVSATGLVTGVAVGTTTLTVSSTARPSVSRTIQVDVSAA